MAASCGAMGSSSIARVDSTEYRGKMIAEIAAGKAGTAAELGATYRTGPRIGSGKVRDSAKSGKDPGFSVADFGKLSTFESEKRTKAISSPPYEPSAWSANCAASVDFPLPFAP